MFLDQWVRFSWDLKKLPKDDPQIVGRAKLRRSDEREDIRRIWLAIERAYVTDTGWGSGLKQRLAEIQKVIVEKSEDSKLTFLVLEDGSRVVGVSGLNAASYPQFVTGVCVAEEYRCRGYGKALLLASLKHLAEAGLQEASVITKTKINASRFLYPKFEGKAEVISKDERNTALSKTKNKKQAKESEPAKELVHE